MAEHASMSWLFLLATTIGLAFTVNAFRPASNRRRFAFIPSFFMSWLTIELAAHHLVWQAAATWMFIELGAMESWPGMIALALVAAQWTGLAYLVAQGRRARHTMERTLAGFVAHWGEQTIHWSHLLFPFPFRIVGARRIKNLVYGRASGHELKLDVFLPPGNGKRRPAIVQIHGGAWIIGDKREQGLPLLMHMAERGWVGFNVNYRLSPAATFPDHLIDIKRAIAWIREHAEEYGVDPSFIAVTGGSAGGHLAALCGLTADDERYQPGFEDADCSVQAVAPIYGAYDLTNRLGHQRPGYVDRFIGPKIIKAFYAEEPHKFHDASPVDRVVADAPPFLVIHGDRDTLTPLHDARLFVERLGAVSQQPVLFAEIQGAQHAFDVFLSPRALPVIEGVGAFLDETHRRAQAMPIPLRADTHATRDELRASAM
jgi:acetyl esterase/lipase